MHKYIEMYANTCVQYTCLCNDYKTYWFLYQWVTDPRVSSNEAYASVLFCASKKNQATGLFEPCPYYDVVGKKWHPHVACKDGVCLIYGGKVCAELSSS